MSSSCCPLAVSVEDDSHIVFANRVSTLKLRIKNTSNRAFRDVYIRPPSGYWSNREVKGNYSGVQLMWGGGSLKGCLVMLPGDKTEIEPGCEGIAYFLVYPGGRSRGTINIPLEICSEGSVVCSKVVKIHVLRGDPRAYIYRPRYVPRLNNSTVSLVNKIIQNYGVPDINTRIWPLNLSMHAPSPRVEIYFEDKRVAVVTGDIGSGFMHVARIKLLRNVFIAEAPCPTGGKTWYWVVRVWFFWLDKSVFDEVPDVERIELWINPETEKVDWLITDEHWKEVVYAGPVDCAEVKITGGKHRTLKSKLIGLVRSYHPPRVKNMKKSIISADSRDPRSKATTLYTPTGN